METANAICAHLLPGYCHKESRGWTYYVCGNCRLHACDDCCGDWKVCISCGGGICSRCEVTAHWRRTTPGPNEYLCNPCGDKYRESRSNLLIALKNIVYNLERGDWVDTVIYDIEAAVAYAQKKADL